MQILYTYYRFYSIMILLHKPSFVYSICKIYPDSYDFYSSSSCAEQHKQIMVAPWAAFADYSVTVET
jgi:hypothetical protein